MIRLTIKQIKEIIGLLPEQVKVLESYEELQKEKARHKRLTKNNPIVGRYKGRNIRKREYQVMLKLFDRVKKKIEDQAT